MTAARSLTDADVDAIADRVVAKLRAPTPKPRREKRKRALVAPDFSVRVSSREHQGPCVYVLLLDGEIVYVGKTHVGFFTRAASHFTNKRFDTIVTLDIATDGEQVDAWLYALERAACDVLQPFDNCRSALRGEERMVEAWGPRLVDLAARIQRACVDSPLPRYEPPPKIDLASLVVR